MRDTANISAIDGGRNEAQKLEKLLDFETQIHDLRHMAHINLTMIEALTSQTRDGGPDGFVKLLLSRDQFDALDFGAGQVAAMARALDQAFLDAYHAAPALA